MSTTTSARRLMALPLMAAWLVTLGMSFEVSACPPGMDMGVEMPMPGGDQAGADHRAQPADAMECPFGGSMDDEGRPNCPLAIGGMGVCVGAAASTPTESAAAPTQVSVGEPALLFALAVRPDHTTEIQLPPPRA